jgi:predicted nucleotidyltransferase
MSAAERLALPMPQIADLCRRYEVSELSLFGSAVRGEMRPDSDFDFLVEYLPEAKPSLLDLSAMMNDLSDLLGRPVDLGVKRALKPRMRDRILAEAQVIYAA